MPKKLQPRSKRFTITYEIITEVSSIRGDFAYNGYVAKDGNTPRKRNSIPKHPATFTLREVVQLIDGLSYRESVECDLCPWSVANPPRWITSLGSFDERHEVTNYSVHPAKRDGITGASMVRLARLFGAYGERKPTALVAA